MLAYFSEHFWVMVSTGFFRFQNWNPGAMITHKCSLGYPSHYFSPEVTVGRNVYCLRMDVV